MGAADDVIEVVWVVVVGGVIVESPQLSAIAVAAEVVSSIVRPFVAAAVGRGGCGGLANRPDTPKNVTRTT